MNQKDTLQSKVKPLTDAFIDSMLQIHEQIKTIRSDLIKEIQSYQKQEEDLKVQKRENSRELVLAKGELTKREEKQDKLNAEIKDEIIRYNRLTTEVERKLTNANQYLKGAEVESKRVFETLEKAKKKEREFMDKLESLRKDSDLIDDRFRKVGERENQNKVQQRIMTQREEKCTQKEGDQKIADLRLKAREIEVARSIKRYNLEEKIKEPI